MLDGAGHRHPAYRALRYRHGLHRQDQPGRQPQPRIDARVSASTAAPASIPCSRERARPQRHPTRRVLRLEAQPALGGGNNAQGAGILSNGSRGVGYDGKWWRADEVIIAGGRPAQGGKGRPGDVPSGERATVRGEGVEGRHGLPAREVRSQPRGHCELRVRCGGRTEERVL